MGVVISSGTRTVKAGQSLVQPNISESGVVIISSGGEVSLASICSGGKMIVSSGGSDSASITFSAGSVFVQPSGFVYDHDVFGKGYVSAAGGRVFGGTVGSSGAMDIFGWSSGGSTVYGYTSNVSIIKGGQMVLGYYATGSALKVSSGYVYVSSGGFLQEAVIGSGVGSSKSAEVYIKPNGSGHFNYVYSNGILTVSSAGSATSTKVYSGGSLIVYSGGQIKETAVQKDGFLLNYGKSYSGTFSGGTAYVYGGSSYHEKLLGGVMQISSYNSSNGYASDLTVQSAIAYLNSGASLVGANVSAGGKLYVYQGAHASAVDVKTSGEVFVKSGGYLYGGSIYGFATIDKGGSAFGGNILLLGYLDVYGSASAFKVSSGGVVAVSSGGRFISGIMSAGARLFVLSGGTALIEQTSGMSATVSGGDLHVYSGRVYGADISNMGAAFLRNGILGSASLSAGELAILSGCTASSVQVTAESSAADLQVGSLGVVSSAIVSGSSARVEVMSAGIINEATILSGANVRVLGRIDSCTIGSSGTITVSSGGCVVNATLDNKAVMTIRNSGSASSVNVSSGGYVTISSGGSLLNAAIYSNGSMYISNGGMESGGCIDVYSSGRLTIADGGYAGKVVLDRFGEMVNYGTAQRVTINNCGRLAVSGGICGISATSGGSAVCFDGLLEGTVAYGGVASFQGGSTRTVTVTSGGRLTITKNLAMSTGKITFMYGGNLNFDISTISSSSSLPLFGNSSGEGYDTFILNPDDAVYSLTVGNVQAEQTYVLACEASTFNSTITLLNTYGDYIGTLTLGSTKKFGDKNYTLNLDDMANLSVTVAAPAPVGGDARNDIDGNGISDVLFQYTGGDYQLGYWMNGTNEWRGQGLRKPAEWEVLGSYDMDYDGMADSVLVGNVEVGGVKGAYIGYYLDSVDTDDNWQNIGYLNNEEDIAWKNKVGNLTGNAGANSIVWYAPELFALGAWTDGTTEWVDISHDFGGDAWKLVGCGDFDGDGKDSVVMSYNGGQLFYAVGIDGASQSLGSANWSGWEVRAIGDFKGDGKDDIVAFDQKSGSMVMCADGNLDDFKSIGQLDASDWFVVGAGDYDGDAKDDLLVRQYSSGMLGYYVSGDTSQWVEMGRGVDMKWTVIA